MGSRVHKSRAASVDPGVAGPELQKTCAEARSFAGSVAEKLGFESSARSDVLGGWLVARTPVNVPSLEQQWVGGKTAPDWSQSIYCSVKTAVPPEDEDPPKLRSHPEMKTGKIASVSGLTTATRLWRGGRSTITSDQLVSNAASCELMNPVLLVCVAMCICGMCPWFVIG